MIYVILCILPESPKKYNHALRRLLSSKCVHRFRQFLAGGAASTQPGFQFWCVHLKPQQGYVTKNVVGFPSCCCTASRRRRTSAACCAPPRPSACRRSPDSRAARQVGRPERITCDSSALLRAGSAFDSNAARSGIQISPFPPMPSSP